jgi:hypothetical protein
MKITNCFNETRELKHSRLFGVSSNFRNGEIINADTIEEAVKLFEDDHPHILNTIKVQEISSFPGWYDIKLVKEV